MPEKNIFPKNFISTNPSKENPELKIMIFPTFTFLYKSGGAGVINEYLT